MLSDTEKETVERQAALKRMNAQRLGGLRALETFTEERFECKGAAALTALKACQGFNPAKDGLYLHGPTGTGKSHLAAIAARKFLPNVYTLKPRTFMRELRGQKDGLEEVRFIERIATSKVLVIDDLGTQNDSEFAVGTFYELIDYRYQWCPGGLIITSNLSIGELADKAQDDRVASRLVQMCKVMSLAGAADGRLERRPK